MQHHDLSATLRDVWALAGGDASILDHVRFRGNDPILPSVFRVGEVASASIAAAGAAAADLWRIRTGVEQDVEVDVRAAATAFRGERYVRIDGEIPPSPWGALSGYFRTGDERYVQLHANFPQHHRGIVDLLGCDDDRAAVKRALAEWAGEQFEDAAARLGLCVGLLRTREEWRASSHAQAVASLPLLEVERVADSPPEPLPAAGTRPLAGVRVLDLTRVIAGPVCGRTLAAHGAEVVRIGGPHLPFLEHVWLDLARGKRSAHLDLRTEPDRETLRGLISDCDVFSQGYRPGTLADRGFGLEDIHALRPGAIYVTLSAYGHEGPWADRRGFDSLVQTVSGICHEGATAAGIDGAKPLPCQALDHATGYLAAFGAMRALARRAQEGGTYRVRVSLAQTAQWLWSLGTIDALDHPEVSFDDVVDLLETRSTFNGAITAIKPAEVLQETPARWERDATVLGTDMPRWQ